MGTTGGSASGSGKASGSLGESGRPRSGGSKGSVPQPNVRDVGAGHLCTFKVHGQTYALSTALVRELVEVTRVTPVPRTAVELVGLFNLRGEPMPLVDLALVLSGTASPESSKMSVIILRSAHISIGARIDALGTVVANQGVIPTDDPNPLILGFLESPGEAPIAVIDPLEFMSRIEDLRVSNERPSKTA